MFRVLEIEDVRDFVSIECDRCQLSQALNIAMSNGRERIELLQEQLNEVTGGCNLWLDGKGGGSLNEEIKVLLSEYKAQIVSLATLRTIYNEL